MGAMKVNKGLWGTCSCTWYYSDIEDAATSDSNNGGKQGSKYFTWAGC